MPLSLSHLNLPARQPEALAQWYEATFGFERRGTVLIGRNTLIVFEQGEPLGARGNTHFGFSVSTKAEVLTWATKVGKSPMMEEDYVGLKISDPEGNIIEIYWEANGPSRKDAAA